MDNLAGRHAFITGGTSGLGLAIALAAAEAGMQVTIAGLRDSHIEEARAAFAARGLGDAVTAISLDVMDRAAFARAVEEAVARYGRIDLVVANAGVGISGTVAGATFDDWDWGLGVNLGGAVNTLVLFLPHLIAQGGDAHIVITSSVTAITPSPRNNVIYSTAKAGLLGMAEGMRAELADHKIGVTIFLPGPYKTNIRESGQNRPARFGNSGYGEFEARLAARPDDPSWPEPEDAAERVMAAIRDNSFYVVTHGEYKGWAESRFEDILAAYPPVDPELLAKMGKRRPSKTE